MYAEFVQNMNVQMCVKRYNECNDIKVCWNFDLKSGFRGLILVESWNMSPPCNVFKGEEKRQVQIKHIPHS